MMRKKLEPGLRAAIDAVGTRYRLAKLVGVTPTAVLAWTRVPNDRIIDVERVTGVDREELRPDLFKR